MAFLKEVRFDWSKVKDKERYPFNIPVLKERQSINLDQNVFFCGGKRNFIHPFYWHIPTASSITSMRKVWSKRFIGKQSTIN